LIFNPQFFQVDLDPKQAPPHRILVPEKFSAKKWCGMEKRRGANYKPRVDKAKLKEDIIGLAVSKDQHLAIQKKAEHAGMTVSAYLRQSALGTQIIARFTDEEMRMFKELIGMSNDIHQLVKKAEKEGATATMLYFIQYGDLIDSIINRFSHDS
jgi:hypothetical protein